MIVDISKTESRLKCDSCGRFISWKDLGDRKATEMFIPDSEVSTEEYSHHCPSCTAKYGVPKSYQFPKYNYYGDV